jgi:predicted enzyme related to lactoylglutathione lyase
MTERSDPLDVLRESVVPIDPDPGFAAALRARLELAVLIHRPTGATTMTNRTTKTTDTGDVAAADADAAADAVTLPPIPPAPGDVVYSSLWVPDLAPALAFYPAVLGWAPAPAREERGRQIPDIAPPMGLWGDVPHGTLFLCHAVDDVQAAVARVRAAGGEAGEPARQPYGLVADCTDDQGMRFSLLEAPVAGRGPLRLAGPGHLLYLTVGVPDSARFRAFYGALFGWEFASGRVEDGWQLDGVRPMMGLRGGAADCTVVPMYGVPDLDAAVAAVRRAGGRATDPQVHPYGRTADCVDNQGLDFYLGQV